MASQRGRTAIGSTGVARHGRKWEGLQARVRRRRRCKPRLSGCIAATGRLAQITLSELVAEYLAQHEAEPRTIAKLRWLLAKANCAFGDRRIVELRSDEIAAWRTRPSRGASLRGDPGATPSPEPSRRLEDHRLEPGQGRRRQPTAATPGEASVRNVGGDRRARRAPRPCLRADDRLRRRHRPAARRMDRARPARPRPRGAGSSTCAGRSRTGG